MPPTPLVAPAPGPLCAAERERYARQLALPGWSEETQLRLKAARILVVGAGGLGSPALLALAAAGVGTLAILDDDVVSLSNLNRQILHDTASIGTSKAENARARLAALNPAIAVHAYAERLSPANAREILARQPWDLILDATDNHPSRYLIDAAATELEIPEVYGAIHGEAGQLAVLASGERARALGLAEVRLPDIFPAPPDTPAAAPPALATITAIVGAMMASEAIKLVTGTGTPATGRLVLVDAASAEVRSVRLAKETP